MSEARFSIGGIRVWFGARVESVRAFNRWLVDDWKKQIKRAWSLRVAGFWLVIQGVLLIWTALDGFVPKWVYVIGGIVFTTAFGLARLTKQPGADGSE